MKNMLVPSSICAGIVAILLAAGCATQQTPGTTEAIAGLAKRKNIAQQWAGEVKRDSNLDAATLKTAKSKYIAAASDNKGYLEAVGNGIINKANLAKDPAYKTLAEKAESSTEEFVAFAKKATGAPEEQRSVGAAVLADVLVNAGIFLWKAHRAETLAQRQAAADRLISQNSWKDWDKIE
jgi:hypothetical protein